VRVLRHPHPGAPAAAIAVGSFDGVHRGHQAIFARTRAAAAARGIAAAALTFEPLPREFFAPREAPPRLTTLAERIAAIGPSGLDLVYAQRFDARFAALTAEAFAERLARGHGARWVIVGEDFRYGARRGGDPDRLRADGRRLGFEVEVLSAVHEGEERISSTRVRELLAAGDLAHAERLLGRPYAMCGRVIHGAKRGRAMGYPTANVRLGRDRPALQGIYAVKCFGAATRGLEGVASLGTNPAVRRGGPATLEAFLFDFSGDLYGRRLTVEFLKKLRDEAHFASIDALAAQIRRDCDDARRFFAAVPR
jgi:riboflavin kinase/FMN adenylyltransferase